MVLFHSPSAIKPSEVFMKSEGLFPHSKTTKPKPKVRIFWNPAARPAPCWYVNIRGQMSFYGPLTKITDLFCNFQPDMTDGELIDAATNMGYCYGSHFTQDDV